MKITKFILFISILLIGLSFKVDWGFYGHKRINRLAVFTLPPELIGFYKENIEFITEHAVDPDKRRYATKHEAVRHYIDIDHWGKAPFDDVPRTWLDMLTKYTGIYTINEKGDTTQLIGCEVDKLEEGVYKKHTGPSVDSIAYKNFIANNVMTQYYEDEWIINCDSLMNLLGSDQIGNCQSAFAKEGFSEYGILPYHLVSMQRRLTSAFQKKSLNAILRTSTEFGHYIGDAHVPLHTTENYNGQLTNQNGIHGFWESRLPELFADETYDYFVGKADYIDDPQTYYWDVILESHTYVDSVLIIERELSKTFPQDQQYCFEDRLGRTVKVPCTDYAAAFHDRLEGQVEARFRASIHTIGSAWYTAWVDAGQPDLGDFSRINITEEDKAKQEELNKRVRDGAIKGRSHGN